MVSDTTIPLLLAQCMPDECSPHMVDNSDGASQRFSQQILKQM